jgi:hypothetical protein
MACFPYTSQNQQLLCDLHHPIINSPTESKRIKINEEAEEITS